MTQGVLRFLGTGSSLGIPIIGCTCPVCLSLDTENTRLRSSVLLQVRGKSILIDAGPDHREQAIRAKIAHIDGVIFTHAHYDHIGGVDDLKVYSFQKNRLECWMAKTTFTSLKQNFSYLFNSYKGESPFFSCHIVEDLYGKGVLSGIEFTYVSYFQDTTPVNGIKIGKLAYISDIKTYEEKIFSELEGTEILIISAARHSRSTMHLSIEEALAFASRLGVKTVYITHISHEIDHHKLQKTLPPSIFLAYDGLEIAF